MSLLTDARLQLMELRHSADLHGHSLEDLRPLQLAAAQEVLEQHREQVPVLDFRAREAGLERLTSLDDLVPLLFSHATYKSYPAGFVAGRRWDRMLKWYDTLAAVPVTDVDLTGVETIDDFVDRLWANGHYAYITSGTSGKCSFLNHTAADRAFSAELRRTQWGWPGSSEIPQPLRPYRFAQPSGPNRGTDNWNNSVDAFADPARVMYLLEEPMRVSHHFEAGAIRKAMADGTASPGDITEYEAAVAARTTKIAARFEEMVEDIAAHHREPLLLSGGWARQYELVEALRGRGIEAGQFHPETVISAGGGRKSPDTPADYIEQISAFYGPVRFLNSGYAMSEMSDGHHACEFGRYHLLPWVVVLILDEPGEKVRTADGGLVEGRYACLDLSFEGRWGGVITGDRVSLDHDGCRCGRPGPTILPGIQRYGELGGEDKITCGGAIDNYVKGLVGA